ncbi:hypothetical protein I3760_11G101400 [Carya illinoinensis]|uniref:Uncharacterized protein n=2 Tax=Carya illinoinensis TaxID=32201 RepID=A0A922DPJ9_CARIL|nr:uncharacterized protein LOC122281940 [Carya illinoinensis]KAG2680490.1 hypothetical protein I3760_11G101400 [Carya illinoinensis]KAG6688007.1 hypothetical protein I3842_11G103200 [Carya illinoinensis]
MRKRETKKKGGRKSSVTELLETPLPMPTPSSPSPPNVSPKSAFFMTNKKNTASASASKFDEDALLPTPLKALSSISDLKDLASSRLDHLKHHIDHSHSEILKDLDASQSRLHKRFKIQTQACQQVMDEAEKEYKKMFERISESREAMKASYAEFMADAQASATRASKTSITELSQSYEKSMDALRSRFGIPST